MTPRIRRRLAAAALIGVALASTQLPLAAALPLACSAMLVLGVGLGVSWRDVEVTREQETTCQPRFTRRQRTRRQPRDTTPNDTSERRFSR